MAIQFARTAYVSRSSGGNSCLKSAYNARNKIECERSGQVFNFNDRSDNIYHNILLPSNVNKIFKDSSYLWNISEKSENRKNSQVAKEAVFALPDNSEITNKHRIELIENFVQKHYVDKGLAAQIDIHAPHEGEKNWHAHVLITTRRFKENGLELGSKARDLNQEIRKGYVAEGWNIGEAWKDHQNAYFKENGLDLKVDATRIIGDEHIGPVRMRRHMSFALERAEALKIANEEAIRTPSEILKKLTRHQATFSERDVEHLLNKHLNVHEIENLKEQIFTDKEVMRLYDRESGDESEYWTTRSVRDEEEKLLRFAESVNERGVKHVDGQVVNKVVESSGLSDEQREAVYHATEVSKGLSIIEGRAGTGKSYVMEHIRKIYEQSGYRLIGIAPTNQVVGDMKDNGFSEAMTVHSALFGYKNGRLSLSKDTVLIIDEAAMLGNSAMVELMHMSRSENVKLIMFGDDRQLSSVERGGMFRELISKFGSSELVEVRRQSGWQREVSELLSEGRSRQAAEILQKESVIDFCKDKEAAISDLVRRWDLDSRLFPEKNRLVLANKNMDVDALNLAIREIRVARGEVSEIGYRCQTQRGSEVFGVNDRICLSVTDKKLGLSNGAFGTIKALDEKSCTLELDSGKIVSFDPGEYQGLKLGYATTVYKSQGKTINSVYVLHDGSVNEKINYVALTRHQETLKIYANREETKSLDHFVHQISRDGDKRSSLGYATFEEVQVRINTQLDGVSKETGIEHGQVQAQTPNIGMWQSLKSKARNFISDTFHRNDEFYQISGKVQSVHSNVNVEKVESGVKTAEVEYVLSSLKDDVSVKDVALCIEEQKRAKGDHSKEVQIGSDNIVSTGSTVSNENNQQKEITSFKTKLQESYKSGYTLTRSLYSDLNEKIKELSQELLGEPTSRTFNQYRYGKKGSVAVMINGEKKGMYSNFETGVHGSAVKMIEDTLNLRTVDAVAWANNWLGRDMMTTHVHIPKPLQVDSQSAVKTGRDKTWTPVFPVPDNIKEPQIKDNPYLSYMAKDREVVSMHAYKNKDGKLLGYVVRLEDKDGLKITPTLTYCRNENGQEHWRWKGFGEDRPLYGLDRLKDDKPILIVEGEKTADAAQKLLPDHAVLSWSGGTGSVSKADWKPLIGKDITIWPDNDYAGVKAAEKITDALKHLNEGENIKAQVIIVDLPKELPEKWDLADRMPPSMNIKKVRELISGFDKVKDIDHSKATDDFSSSVKGSDFAKIQEEIAAEYKGQNLNDMILDFKTMLDKIYQGAAPKENIEKVRDLITGSDKVKDIDHSKATDDFSSSVKGSSFAKMQAEIAAEYKGMTIEEMISSTRSRYGSSNLNIEFQKENSVWQNSNPDQYVKRFDEFQKEVLNKVSEIEKINSQGSVNSSAAKPINSYTLASEFIKEYNAFALSESIKQLTPESKAAFEEKAMIFRDNEEAFSHIKRGYPEIGQRVEKIYNIRETQRIEREHQKNTAISVNRGFGISI